MRPPAATWVASDLPDELGEVAPPVGVPPPEEEEPDSLPELDEPPAELAVEDDPDW